MLRIILKVLGVLFIILGLSFFIFTPNQIQKDAKFYGEFQQSREFVESYHQLNGRYPTDDQFRAWSSEDKTNGNINFITNTIPKDSLIDIESHITSNDNYILSSWRGEWFVYYIAQNNEFLPRKWSYFAALKKLLWYGLIGLVLLIIARKMKPMKMPNKSQ